MKNLFPSIFAKSLSAALLLVLVALAHVTASAAVAQEVVQEPVVTQLDIAIPEKPVEAGGQVELSAKAPVELAPTYGKRRALIVCGMPGDKDYLESFTESIVQIQTALTDKFGFDKDNIRIQFGRGPDQPEPESFAAHGRATKEEIETEIKNLVKQSSAEDLTWVFVIGHAYYDGKTVFLNVPDTDLTHRKFVAAFKELNAKQSAFFICTPASGYFIKGLSKPNRVIVTSTEADQETNGTIFHTALATAFEEISPDSEFDFDKDGHVSIVDLYIKATKNLADAYLSNQRPLYPTEHPNFEDNGDGRGSEIQVHYLTPEQGGLEPGQRRRTWGKVDGLVASKVALPFVSKPIEVEPSTGVADAAEETPVEETPVEETPAEETAAEETSAEETPAEETTEDQDQS